jgi:hypothetical protein
MQACIFSVSWPNSGTGKHWTHSENFPPPLPKPFKGECIFQVVAVTLQLKGRKLSIVIKEEKSFTEKSS